MRHGDGHMNHVPNPTRPTTNCHFTPTFLIYTNHEFDLARKNIAKVLAFSAIGKTSNIPKILAKYESTIPLCCPCSMLIVTDHGGSCDVNYLAVCPTSDINKFEILLHGSGHALSIQ